MGVKRLSKREVFVAYKKKFSIFLVEDLVDSKRIKKSFLVENDSVTVIPILDDGRILLIREYRPAIFGKVKGKENGYVYEVPTGHIDKGEDKAASAKRELEEETGYVAGSVKFLYARFTAPWITTNYDYVFVAQRLKKTKQKLMFDESIQTVPMSVRKVEAALKSGKINDSVSREALFHWLYFYKKRK